MTNDLEFKDTLSYKAPDAPDCLMVPEAQWDDLFTSLADTHSVRDHLLWVLCGICGGGFLSCVTSFVVFPETGSGLIKLGFMISGIVLLLASVVLAVVAHQLSGDSVAEKVHKQMEVLKMGFRRLTTDKQDDP